MREIMSRIETEKWGVCPWDGYFCNRGLASFASPTPAKGKFQFIGIHPSGNAVQTAKQPFWDFGMLSSCSRPIVR
jgi:hypothetical protein